MTTVFAPNLLAYEAVLETVAAMFGAAPIRELSLAQALGYISAGQTRTAQDLPAQTTVRLDGYACHALDLAGASTFSPVAILPMPQWYETGAHIPANFDAILPKAACTASGAFALATEEVLPGEGLWRQGEWLSKNHIIVPKGQKIGPLSLHLAHQSGISHIACHVIKVCLIDVTDASICGVSTQILAHWLRAQSVELEIRVTNGRGPAAIADALSQSTADLTLLIGGSGEGATDHVGAVLNSQAKLISRGAGLFGLGDVRLAEYEAKLVLAIPGSLEAVLSAALTLIAPLLERAYNTRPAHRLSLPLHSKIASPVGLAQLVLLIEDDGTWRALNTAWPSPLAFAQAQAYTVIASGDEGFAQGHALSAIMLQEHAFS